MLQAGVLCNLQFLPVISTCETGITILERTFDTI
jgi:hypothetical protein